MIECTFGRDFQVYTFGRTTLLEDTVLLEEMHFWKKYTFGRLCILLAEPPNFKPFQWFQKMFRVYFVSKLVNSNFIRFSVLVSKKKFFLQTFFRLCCEPLLIMILGQTCKLFERKSQTRKKKQKKREMAEVERMHSWTLLYRSWIYLTGGFTQSF